MQRDPYENYGIVFLNDPVTKLNIVNPNKMALGSLKERKDFTFDDERFISVEEIENRPINDSLVEPRKVVGVAFDFVKKATDIAVELASGRDAVVYCIHSRSRSPSAIAMFFIVFRGMKFDELAVWLKSACKLQRELTGSHIPNLGTLEKFEMCLKYVQKLFEGGDLQDLIETVIQRSSGNEKVEEWVRTNWGQVQSIEIDNGDRSPLRKPPADLKGAALETYYPPSCGGRSAKKIDADSNGRRRRLHSAKKEIFPKAYAKRNCSWLTEVTTRKKDYGRANLKSVVDAMDVEDLEGCCENHVSRSARGSKDKKKTIKSEISKMDDDTIEEVYFDMFTALKAIAIRDGGEVRLQQIFEQKTGKPAGVSYEVLPYRILTDEPKEKKEDYSPAIATDNLVGSSEEKKEDFSPATSASYHSEDSSEASDDDDDDDDDDILKTPQHGDVFKSGKKAAQEEVGGADDNNNGNNAEERLTKKCAAVGADINKESAMNVLDMGMDAVRAQSQERIEELREKKEAVVAEKKRRAEKNIFDTVRKALSATNDVDAMNKFWQDCKATVEGLDGQLLGVQIEYQGKIKEEEEQTKVFSETAIRMLKLVAGEGTEAPQISR